MADISKATDRHTSIGLPSQFVFYPDLAEISIRKFNVVDMNALNGAKKRRDLRAFVEAVGRTITIQPFDMTQEDFEFICLWHRNNSFPKQPLVYNWECTNPEHVAQANLELRDEDPDNPDPKMIEYNDSVTLAKKTLKNGITVTSAMIPPKVIDKDRLGRISEFMKKRMGDGLLEFHTPTMMDLIEAIELQEIDVRRQKLDTMLLSPESMQAVLEEIASATQDEILIRLASNLHRKYGVSLYDRIKFVQGLEEDRPELIGTELLSDLDEWEELTTHGVETEIKSTCRGCKHPVSIELDIDLFEMFPLLGQ